KSVTSKGTLTAGQSEILTVKVANLTIATAGKSVVRVYRLKGGAVLGEKKLSKLKKQEKDLSIKIKLPGDFKADRERLEITIDPDNQVVEEDETNNDSFFVSY
ncbi:MAG: CARDB domain-containing protein, partial [Chitinophagales bacterium]